MEAARAHVPYFPLGGFSPLQSSTLDTIAGNARSLARPDEAATLEEPNSLQDYRDTMARVEKTLSSPHTVAFGRTQQAGERQH